jgi:group I intron endonuclease
MIRFRHISGIYQIQSKINGKIYIGSAVNIGKRWKEHIMSLRYNKNTRHLQNHTNKYGVDDLVFSIVESCPKKKLIEREQYYMDLLHPAFNIRKKAESNLGVKFTEETKRKISESQKGKIIPIEQRQQISKTLLGHIPWSKGRKMKTPPWNKGKKGSQVPWNKGKKASPEALLHQSISHKGCKISEETKRKLSKSLCKAIEERGGHWNKGFHHSEETKEKIALYQKGRKKNPESVRKSAEKRTGRIVSMETRMKISESKRKKII